MLAGLQRILRESAGKSILLVGHRSTNRVILAYLLGWPPEAAVRLNLRSRFLYQIDRGETPQVISHSLRPQDCGRQLLGFHT